MVHHRLLTIGIAFFLLAGNLVCELSFADERPKIGLALAGGGARGAAHIGILKRLKELRIPVDYIAGTSFGAIIGGLYAAGKSPEELEQIINEINWNAVFRDKPPRKQLSPRRKVEDNIYLVDKLPGIKDGKLKLPQGIFQGQAFYTLIKDLTLSASSIKDFNDFSPPFRAIATDLETGEAVVIDHGDLATAIRASMSVPAIFAPVEINGRLLVDGGLANNLPINVVREMGADIVIAVDISSPFVDREHLDNVLAVAYQLTNFLTRNNTLRQLESLTEKDILLIPDLQNVDSSDFESTDRAIDIGYKNAFLNSSKLLHLSMSEQDYAGYELHRSEIIVAEIVVEYVDIKTGENISESLLRKKITQPLNQLLDVDLMNESLGNINGLGYFESVFYDVTERNGMKGVTITAKPRSWGPKYIQLGARYSNNLAGDDGLDLRLGYLIAPRGPDGSEWSTNLSLGEETGLSTEYFRPLKPDSSYFYSLRAGVGRQRFNTFDDGDLIAQSDITRFGASARFGRFLGLRGETSFGYQFYVGEQEDRIGIIIDSSSDIDGGEIFGKLVYDSLDSISFPKHGNYLEFNGLRSDQDLGASDDFGQYGLDYFGALSTKSLTFTGGARLQLTTLGKAPLQNRYRFGGLFEMGGVNDNEFSTQNLLLLRAGIARQMNTFLGSNMWIGGLLQHANPVVDTDDFSFDDGILGGSMYLGWNTLLGPLYLGYGVSEGGNNSIHLLLGKQF
jgi:NTE family protein